MASARGIVVEVIGDDRSALRMWERQTLGAETTGKAYKKFALTATETANLQVAAAVKAQKATQANILALQAAAARAPAGSAEQIAATTLAANAQKKLAVSQGLTVASTQRLSAATKTGERDLGKIVRGGLAGSGAFHALGRSLAFASGGFLAFAIGAGLIAKSISAARDFGVAQKQADTQLKVAGKSFADYGNQINTADSHLVHLAGFTRTELLSSFTTLFRVTGNVSNSLHLTSVAADVARGRHIALAAASNALAKAAGGSFSALRRLNIIVPKGATTLQALTFVQQKYAGQAAAGTTASQRFSATLDETEIIIGQKLLPIVNRYLVRLGDWLSKMNETGRLQRDVNAVVGTAGDIFRTLGQVIGRVDKVTGSFAHTLEILLALRFAAIINRSWVPALEGLALKFGAVEGAATAAAGAETAAIGAGAAGPARAVTTAERTAATGLIAGGLPLPLAVRRRAAARAAAKAIGGSGGETAAVGGSRFAGIGSAVIPITLLITDTKVTDNAQKQLHDIIHGNTSDAVKSGLSAGLEAAKRLGILGKDKLITPFTGVLPIANITRAFQQIFGSGPRGSNSPGNLRNALGGSPFTQGPPTTARQPAAQQTPFGTAKPLTQFFKQFQLNFQQQLAQVQASLTTSTKDDVTAARAVVADIKKKIDAGELHGQALLQGLQLEATAVSTIQSAEAAAAQERAAKAQALKAKIQAQIENSINPIDLQLAVARDEAAGKSTLKDLERQRQAARRALASGKLDKQQQLEALNQITSLNQQIADARKQTTKSFTQSLKLQIALARAQAFGTDTTPILERMKRALLRALHSGKFHGQALIDLLNQISDINSQLNSATSSSLNFFKQLNTRALTAGLGLTPEQRAALRARLSQVGPHGTVPGTGVGAAGFVIGADDRPIVIHHETKLDGRPIEKSTTKLQQKRRRRSSSQRRGPNAGG